MKGMKRGLLMLVILLFGVGSVRLAYAIPACDTDELPKNANYSFEMVGSDVITVHDVPTTAFSGVFTTATARRNEDNRVTMTADGDMNSRVTRLYDPDSDCLSPGAVLDDTDGSSDSQAAGYSANRARVH